MVCIAIKGGWGRGHILRNSAGDEVEEGGAQTKGLFAKKIIDMCTEAST